jgi:MFS transporter, MHS family, proline/betaine transporter
VPFLVAGPLGIVGLYLRLKLEDTPNFKALEEAHEVAQPPCGRPSRSGGQYSG